MYNVAKYIGGTVAGLQAQTLNNIEFILVDDGSTDNTAEICAGIDDPRFRLVGQHNQGPSAARNHGIRSADGDYICFVDADDILLPDALEVMYTAAKDNDADLITGNSQRFNSTGVWPISHAANDLTEPGNKTLATHPELMQSLGPWAKLYRRDLIEATFFPEHIRLGEDQPFVLRAYSHAKKIHTVDQDVYHYRCQDDKRASLTSRVIAPPGVVLSDLFEMVRMARTILADDSLFDRYLARAMHRDIWARVDAALRTRDPDIQVPALKAVRNWLEDYDKETFNRVRDLHTIPLVGAFFRLPKLREGAVGAAGELCAMILRNLTVLNILRLPIDVVRVAKRLGRS
jgi:hypothetical protein